MRGLKSFNLGLGLSVGFRPAVETSVWLRIEDGDKFRTSDCGFTLLPSNTGEKTSRPGLARGIFLCVSGPIVCILRTLDRPF